MPVQIIETTAFDPRYKTLYRLGGIASQDFTATLPAHRLPFDGCGGSDPLRHYGSSA